MRRLRRTLANISSTTLVYQAKITNAHPDDAVGTRLSRIVRETSRDAFEVRFYSQVANICGVPSQENIRRACGELNWLSTGMTSIKQEGFNKDWPEENTLALEKLGQLLGIDTRF